MQAEDDLVTSLVSAPQLPREFFGGPTREVARRLLGKFLLSSSPEGVAGGRIVETEAYLSEDDPGCHAARGKTARNAPMFEQPGTIYVYRIYGMHVCLNLVTRPVGTPEAVLIRALEPLAGLELMRRRRGRPDVGALCSGPAKLCQALGVGLEHNRSEITAGGLRVLDIGDQPSGIVTTTRVGLGQGCGEELPLRFYLAGNAYISRK